MRRALGALAALLLVIALATALPAGSGATPTAGAAGKHRCKHRAEHYRKKRCRKKKTATGPSTTRPKGDDPSAPSGPPGRVLATERELSPTQLQLQLSRATVAAGTTVVEQYNAGSDPHNLILERKGTVAFAYPTLDPGGDQKQTLTLTKGTWTLYCSLLNHKDLGMQATLTVS
jgi:plastocyanin